MRPDPSFWFDAKRWMARGRAAWGILLLTLAVATFYLVQPLTVARIARAQVKVMPFTIQQEQYAFNGQFPRGTLVGKVTTAVRSDGSTVAIGDVFGQLGFAAQETSRSITLSDGRRYMIFDGIQSMLPVLRFSAKDLAIRKEAMLNASSNCAYPGYTPIGYGEMQGYKVDILKWLPPPGNTSTIFTVWKAPELGCETVQSRDQERQPDGSLKTIAETRLVNVALGEPDPSLFEIPSNYATVKPSDAMRKEANRLGKPWTDFDQKIADRDDAALAQHMALPNQP